MREMSPDEKGAAVSFSRYLGAPGKLRFDAGDSSNGYSTSIR
jgi:hypothetical protein